MCFALWLLLTALLLWAQRPGRPRIVIWSGLTLTMPWILLKGYALLTVWPMPHALSVSVFAVCLIALFSLLLSWRPTFLPPFERAQHFVADAARIRCSQRFARSRPAAVVRMAGPFAQRSAHLAPASDGDFAPVRKDTSDLVTTRRTFVSTGLRATFSRAKARCLRPTRCSIDSLHPCCSGRQPYRSSCPLSDDRCAC